MTFEAPNTKNQPIVSVIMNCLNCSKYVHEAIDSVYAQTYKNWEIIFWDNSSTDSSAEIARSYDERVRYFRGDRTVPLYAARNYALKQARGKYIAFLDCDDIWLPEKLEWQVPMFERDSEIGLIYTNVVFASYLYERAYRVDFSKYQSRVPRGYPWVNAA